MNCGTFAKHFRSLLLQVEVLQCLPVGPIMSRRSVRLSGGCGVEDTLMLRTKSLRLLIEGAGELRRPTPPAILLLTIMLGLFTPRGGLEWTANSGSA
jgi:hypothetical protein